MPREAHIPIVLWACTALVFHAFIGGGAEQVKEVQEHLEQDRAAIRGLVRDVRSGIGGPTMEVEVLDPDKPPDQDAEADPNQPDDDVEKTDDQTAPDEAPPKIDTPKDPEKKVEAPPPIKPPELPPPAEPPPPPKPEPKKEEPKKDEPKKQEPLKVEIDPKKAIAVANTDPNKVRNDEANRISKFANKVDAETQSRTRALDRNDPKPTPGSNMRGSSDAIGDSTKDHSGQSESKAGDTKRAPGESAKSSESASHEAPKPPEPPTVARSSANGGPGLKPVAPSAASRGASGGLGPATPESMAADAGTWSLDPAKPGGNGASNKRGQKSKKRDFVPGRVGSGLLAGNQPGGPMNLGWAGFEHSVGAEELRKERESAGAAIRAEHAGRYDTSKFERWRPAIENYDPSVKLGNETALNSAENPFAEYLQTIHNRLHPIFGDEFLGSGVASSEGLDDMTLITHVELVLDKSEGKIVRMGIVKRSGSTIFDAVALEALDRASPFGKAPDVIVSPDGNVYLHWEFHRDPFDACSSRNARPILLKNPPKLKPNLPARPKKAQPKGENAGHDDAPDGPMLPTRKK